MSGSRGGAGEARGVEAWGVGSGREAQLGGDQCRRRSLEVSVGGAARRSLVEQLSKVDPSCMNCDEWLAFWINLYNALIMHAYLAYGVPRNDIKLFSLMQKAYYMVGGQSFSVAEIEFVILQMKTPVHRPQLSLMLALHKIRVIEEHKKYSIDDTQPLVLFALSCGMFSSPAGPSLQLFSICYQVKVPGSMIWRWIRLFVPEGAAAVAAL